MQKRDNEKFNNEVVLKQFGEGFDCGQVITSYFARKYNQDEKLATKMAGSFGGGMFQGSVCGAYIGGLMAIGMIFGQEEPNDMETKGKMIAKTAEFQMKYKEECEHEVCEDLLGGNLTDPVEGERIEKEGLLTTFCPNLVIKVIDIVESLEEE